MNFQERIGWLIVGCMIGFAVGYIVRYLQEIKDELDEVDDIVTKLARDPNDDGFVSSHIVGDIALLIVVLLVVWAAFSSQSASNDAKDTQRRFAQTTTCNQEYLTKTVRALNERTEFTQQQASANVDLQKAQADFFALLLRKPPESVAVRTDAAQTYLRTLTDFVAVSGKSAKKVEQYPFPTPEELSACFER